MDLPKNRDRASPWDAKTRYSGYSLWCAFGWSAQSEMSSYSIERPALRWDSDLTLEG